MNKNEKKLISIISDELKIPQDKINKYNSANDFPEWDSLSNVRLILRISDEFKVQISFGDTISVDNIEDLLKVIETKLDTN